MVGSKIQRLADLRRKKATKAEAALELALTASKLKGLFQREWPIAGYRVDFFFHEARLAVEVDGKYHFEDEQIQRDRKKDLFLKKHSIYVLRFTNEAVLEKIETVITKIMAFHDVRKKGN